MRWLITGYGPFEQIKDNISARVAERLGERYDILEVSYAAVDEYIASLDPNSFDAWLAMGHANNATKIRIEGLGRNQIGPRPDVRGEGRLNEAIRDGEEHRQATLWTASELQAECDDWIATDDAGGYLCNYVLFRGLETFPDKKVGFLHLPPPEAVPLETQVEIVKRIMSLCTPKAA